MLEVSDSGCYDINDSRDSQAYIDLTSWRGRSSSAIGVSQIPLTACLVADDRS